MPGTPARPDVQKDQNARPNVQILHAPPCTVTNRNKEEEYSSDDFRKVAKLEQHPLELSVQVSNDVIDKFYAQFRVAAQSGGIGVPRPTMRKSRRDAIGKLLANFTQEEIGAGLNAIINCGDWAKKQSFFTIDWIIVPENFEKVAEGKYADRKIYDKSGPRVEEGDDGRFSSKLPGYGPEALNGSD